MSTKGKQTNQQTGKGKQQQTVAKPQETKKTNAVTQTAAAGATGRRVENRGKNSPQVQKSQPNTPGLDDSAEQKVIKDIQDKMSVLKKEKEAINTKIEKINDRKPIIEKLSETINKKGEETKQWRSELDAAFETKKQKKAEMDKITEKIPHKWKPKVDTVEVFLHKNTEALTQERDQLSQEIQNCKSVQEQRILIQRKDAAVTKLKNLERFKECQAAFQAADNDIERLKPLLDTERTAKNKLIDTRNEEHEKRKELKALITRKDEIKKQQEELYQEILAARAVLDTKWKNWKQERENSRLDKIKQDQKVLPYKIELETTKKVLKYLNELKTQESEEETLKHTPYVHAQFDFLSLLAPKKKSDISTSLEEVEKRKQEYQDILAKYRARFEIPEEVKPQKKKNEKKTEKKETETQKEVPPVAEADEKSVPEASEKPAEPESEEKVEAAEN